MIGPRTKHLQVVCWQMLAFVLAAFIIVKVGHSFNRELSFYLPETSSSPSTYNNKPTGYAGLRELACRVGLKVGTWEKPYRELAGTRGTLVIIEPSEPPADHEVDEMLSWVDKGNDLVYLDSFGLKSRTTLLDKLGLGVRLALGAHEESIPVSVFEPEFAHVKRLVIAAPANLLGGNALVSNQHGAVLLTMKHGSGHLLLGTSPSLAANYRLGTRDGWSNFQFLINWLSRTPGNIWFDELCHGYSSSRNVFLWIANSPIKSIFLPLAIMLLLSIAASLQGFGSPLELKHRRAISNLEFVNGMAATCRRARAAFETWEILAHSFRCNLCRALGLSMHATDYELITSWSHIDKEHSQDLSTILARSQQIRRQKQLTEEELRELVWLCDKITQDSGDLLQSSSTQRGKHSR